MIRARSSLLAVLLLGACATPPTPTPAVKVCAAIVTYSSADQAKASAELKALPAGDILAAMIIDYGALRAQTRACQASQ